MTHTAVTTDFLRARLRGDTIIVPADFGAPRTAPAALALALVAALGSVAAAFALAL